jgi:hypothetical protein
MPANFPEIWINRLIQNLDNSDKATFLEGIPELSADIQVINDGQPTEKNIIYVAATDFETEVLINNNTYPIPAQVYDDDTIAITLDKYQTKVVSISDDDTMGASYDKIDVIQRSGKRAIVTSKYKKAIHSIAPLADTVDTPVISATGGPDGLTDSSGRFRLTYEDLVAAKEATKGFGLKRLVLNETHWNDLLLDRKNFGNQLIDYAKGKPNPMIAGFELHQYEGDMPIFTAAKAKKPFGSIQDPTDRVASVIFVKEAIGKKTGLTKQYFAPAASNPAGQTNDLAYRHYYVAVPFQAKKIGAII